MWIRTQNKQKIINSDQLVSIFINNNGTTICAAENNDNIYILGEYKDRDACLKVLDDLFATCFPNGCTCRMPLGGEV